MASADNPRLPLTSGTAPVVKYTETRRDSPRASTSINMSSMRSKPANNLSINEYELRRLPTRQRRVVKKTLMANVGYRLGKRKNLHIQRFVRVRFVCVTMSAVFLPSFLAL